jgi:hypothetical protein
LFLAGFLFYGTGLFVFMDEKELNRMTDKELNRWIRKLENQISFRRERIRIAGALLGEFLKNLAQAKAALKARQKS